jgi:hypothetical protein
VRADAAPLVVDGTPVGVAASTSAGPGVGATATAQVVDSTAATAGVVYVADNKVGVAQHGDMGGNYQGTVATAGDATGSGSGYATNTPLPANNGSNAEFGGQWNAPANDYSVTVSGTADFTSMQVPKITGGIEVTTPFGTFKTPAIG